MKIVPINTNTTVSLFGAFMEGAIPNPLNYDIQTLLNNMVSSRIFTSTPTGQGAQTLTPISVASYQVSPPPAWTTVQGYRGKRVLPKVTLLHSKSYQDLYFVNYASNVQFQLDVIASTILNHRVADSTSGGAARIAAWPASSTAAMMVPKTRNADNVWEYVNYDFGADITLNSLAALIGTNATATQNLFANNSTNQVFLQVLQGTTWTDVTNLSVNMYTTVANTEKFFALPSPVTGRRFRIVSKYGTNPFPSGISAFALHFYGDYTAGVSPRVINKVGHVTLFKAVSAAWTYMFNFSTDSMYNYGRAFGHYALSVTDDLKQSANYDVFVSDTTVVPGQEQAVGIIYINNKIINTEAY
ncbi:MAG: hypothetical protein RR672_04275 [Raoultibacter sp.]